MKQKIYISGKITGLDYDEAFAAFENAEKFVEALGYEAVNPMKLADQSEGKEWIEYMVEDLRILDKCDGIFMMSNWRDSDGARLEKVFCEIRKKRIMYESLQVAALAASMEITA